MKKKRLLLIPAILVLAGGAFWILHKSSNTPANPSESASDKVVSREHRSSPTPERESIEGYARFMSRIKANSYTGIVSSRDVKKAVEQANQAPRSKKEFGLEWKNLGPDNIGGRTRAIVIDKDNPNIIYAGGVSGGFWKSTNWGNSWTAKDYSGDYTNLCIVSMTQASNGTLYFGTGEQNFLLISSYASGTTTSGSIGMGIWKSTDRGETWEQLKSTIPQPKYGNRSAWDNVNDLASDPNDPNRIFAGTTRGLKISGDGGQSWTDAQGISSSFVIEDIKISPGGKNIFVSSQSRLFRSTNSGNTFQQISGTGNFPVSGIGRIEIAISPSDPDYIYASVSDNNGKLLNIYQSSDNGNSWQIIGHGGGNFHPFSVRAGDVTGQGRYDNVIAVDPEDPEKVYLGGVYFWIYDKGQWIQGAPYSGSPLPFDYYLHVDIHKIAFDTKSDNKSMYIGTDGGIFKSTDYHIRKNPTYSPINNQYNVTQFFNLAASYTGDIIGGTQDNNTLRFETKGLTGKSAKSIFGGDGFYCEISKINPNIFFGEATYGNLVRTRDRGRTGSGFFDNHVPDPEQPSFPFRTPFRLWEKRNDTTSRDSIIFVAAQDYKSGDTLEVKSRSSTTFLHVLKQRIDSGQSLKIQDKVQSRLLLAGRNRDGNYIRLFLTKDALNFNITPVWFELTDRSDMSGSRIPRDIEIASDGNHAYVATSDFRNGGVLYRVSGLRTARLSYDYKILKPSQDTVYDPLDTIPRDQYDKKIFLADSAGIEITSIYSIPGQVITGIGIDPNDPDRVTIALGNYGTGQNHVYYSENALDSAHNVRFNALDRVGNNPLPTMPVYDVLFNMEQPNQIFAATELGIWGFDLSNRPAGWSEENQGMKRVPTFEIRQYKFKPWHTGPVIYIATHGRGVYKSESLVTNLSISDEDQQKESTQENHSWARLFPNPANNHTNIEVQLPHQTPLSMYLYDINGNLVIKKDYGIQPGGKNRYRFNTSRLQPGSYFLRLNNGASPKTLKLLVTQ